MPPDTVAQMLREGRRRLEGAHIESPALDARLLLQYALDLPREALIAEPARLVTDDAAAAYRSMISRRSGHEPVSRIIGRREFYGRDFTVTPAVLDPRPDTETLIEVALPFLPVDRAANILDLGTGSAAIIITLLAERPLARGIASDVSEAALCVGRTNAIRHGVESRLTFIATEWFQNLAGTFEIIVANPPYIPRNDIVRLAPEVGHFDPISALDGGPDGLDAYRQIAQEAASHLTQDGRILVEIGENQVGAVTAIFIQHGFVAAGRWDDLGGRIRCLGFTCR